MKTKPRSLYHCHWYDYDHSDTGYYSNIKLIHDSSQLTYIDQYSDFLKELSHKAQNTEQEHNFEVLVDGAWEQNEAVVGNVTTNSDGSTVLAGTGSWEDDDGNAYSEFHSMEFFKDMGNITLTHSVDGEVYFIGKCFETSGQSNNHSDGMIDLGTKL